MKYAALLPALLVLLTACGGNESEEVEALEEMVRAQNATIAEQRAELEDLHATLDTAGIVAADSALAHAETIYDVDEPAVARTEPRSTPQRTRPRTEPAPRPAPRRAEAPTPRGEDRAGEAPPAEAARPSRDALTYTTYRNDRFGFTLNYPANLFRPDESLGDGHGQSFVSTDGSATLLLYGTEEGGPDALRGEYEAERNRDDLRITYHVLRPNWFVISGYEGPYIFYQRTHRAGDGLRTLYIRHRAADRAYFSPIIERLSRSFAG
ncbi:MAG TPA: hypothetical protein VD962_09215 [Rubricoccaceae bacterium]|nr:hypothetical protein [Rubricoccaceae bacterium]